MKRYISFFLVCSILNLSCATISPTRGEVDPRKKGADLIILKVNGQPVRGELIAVKKDSLLLLQRNSGADVTVDIGDVGAITFKRRSNVIAGAVFGLLLGGAIGLAIAQDKYAESGFEAFFGFFGFSLGGASIGLIVGGIVGALSGGDKTIRFTNKSDSEIQEILGKLRKKARIRNYQ